MRTFTNYPNSAHQPDTSRPVVSRRRLFALTGLVGATALTASACTTDVVTDAVRGTSIGGGEVNHGILDALAAVRARAAAGDEWSAMFQGQAELLEKEYLRQCGENSDGEHPQECVDALNAVPEEGKKSDAVKALWNVATDGDSSGLLTGIYAAAYTSLPTATPGELDKLRQVDVMATEESDASSGTGQDIPEGFDALLDMTYAAIYASGVALAADAGKNRAVLAIIADRMRVLRDRIVFGYEQRNATVPEPAAGYVADEQASDDLNQPQDSASAAQYLYAALSPITQQLRHLSSTLGEQPDGAVVSWCGLMARGEAALEPLFGHDPRAVITRGDS